jgi:hypothetical protein
MLVVIGGRRENEELFIGYRVSLEKVLVIACPAL